MKTLPLDITGKQLIPGRLYCLGEITENYPNDLKMGSLAWFGSDGEFYDADHDDGTTVNWPYDVAVEQTGCFNKDYA
jgi:hypothetical protein